jgi:hypothetical protein
VPVADLVPSTEHSYVRILRCSVVQARLFWQKMQHQGADPFLVTDDEDDDCCSIHWAAATIIQKRCRGFLVSLCYKELQQHQREMAPRCHRIYLAKVRVALRFQGQWQWFSKKKEMTPKCRWINMSKVRVALRLQRQWCIKIDNIM